MTDRPLLLAALLAAAALACIPSAGPRRPGRRYRIPDPWRRHLLVGGAAASTGTLLSLPPWLVLLLTGTIVITVQRWRRRTKPLTDTQLDALAAALDLVAACLEAGLPIERAIDAVNQTWHEESDSPPFAALARVAALLRLGGTAAQAWHPALQSPELEALARAATRSAVGGGRLAEAVRDTAADLRRRTRTRAVARNSRASVVVTAPLVLCFLPAFFCIGIAPMLIGLLGSLSIFG